MVWLLLAGCDWFGGNRELVLEPPSVVEAPTPRKPAAIRLASARGSFTLPASNRPDSAPAPTTWSVAGPWTERRKGKEHTTFEAPLPLLDSLMPDKAHGTHTFGSSAPPGFTVFYRGEELKHARKARGAGTFGFDRESLFVGLSSSSPPKPGDLVVSFDRATAAEARLNRSTAETSDEEFVVRAHTVGTRSTSGLYLPAPAEASFSIEVPPSGVFTANAMVLPPAIFEGKSSGGATVEVLVGGKRLDAVEVSSAVPSSLRVELGDYAGKTVDLVLRTLPGADPLLDYVFLEDPVVYEPKENPRRMLLVFIDTLRPDHLGLYGYDRPTSPNLDAWAEHAAVFESARTVAPWTLPSARAALSGRQPELWFEGQSLAGAMAADGWRTTALVSNAFLSQPFDMHKGWDSFTYTHLSPAEDLMNEAVAAMRATPDRDLLLLVHFMEPHLPYDEPGWAEGMFAGSRPSEVESVTRVKLVKANEKTPGIEKIKAYIKGRYDQNIRVVDDALVPVLQEAGPDATVALFSDHGEEFWEHGGFEHGHTFHDELLRVPLVIRSPNIQAGRFPQPVSLLDLTPTLLEIAGVAPTDGLQGSSLVPLAFGREGTAQFFASRPQAFGRPLYGEDGWGVVREQTKWIDRDGRQRWFELDSDPGELKDVALSPGRDFQSMADSMGHALGTAVVHGYRVETRVPKSSSPQVLEFSRPDGFLAAWNSYDPRGRAQTHPEVVDGKVVVRIPADSAPPVMYLQPNGDPLALAGLGVRIEAGGQEIMRMVLADDTPAASDRASHPVVLSNTNYATIRMAPAWVPVPAGVEVSGFHPDLAEQLEELGYVAP